MAHIHLPDIVYWQMLKKAGGYDNMKTLVWQGHCIVFVFVFYLIGHCVLANAWKCRRRIWYYEDIGLTHGRCSGPTICKGGGVPLQRGMSFFLKEGYLAFIIMMIIMQIGGIITIIDGIQLGIIIVDNYNAVRMIIIMMIIMHLGGIWREIWRRISRQTSWQHFPSSSESSSSSSTPSLSSSPSSPSSLTSSTSSWVSIGPLGPYKGGIFGKSWPMGSNELSGGQQVFR